MSKNISQGRFRHELKFVIPLEEAGPLFDAMLEFGEYDKHGGSTHMYEIASTYYDTEDLRFYVDREESVGYRRKVRLRSYNNEGQSKALFVEIKEKHKNLVFKKRVNLRSGELLELCDAHNEIPFDLVIDQLEDGAEARELAYLHKRLRLEPAIIIRYLRKALIPSYEHDMRVTLDTRITAGGSRLERYSESDEDIILDAELGVFEVKSNTSIPLWLHSLMRKCHLTQVRYSKYCLGMDECFGAAYSVFRPGSLGNPSLSELKAKRQSETQDDEKKNDETLPRAVGQ